MAAIVDALLAWPPRHLLAVVMAALAGWVLGFLSRQGAGKWRRRWQMERGYYAAFRAEAHAALARQRQRIADLERAEAATAETAAPAPAPPSLQPAADAAESPPAAAPGTGALAGLSGIDAALAEKLAALGVVDPRDIATLDPLDEIALEQRLGLPAGYIAREQWRQQAAALIGPSPGDEGPAPPLSGPDLPAVFYAKSTPLTRGGMWRAAAAGLRGRSTRPDR